MDAVRALCLKFPAKYCTMLEFLATNLREEGGYEFKKSLIEGIFDIIHAIPESKESAFEHLCEYIEDCEFTRLAVRILYILGEEGPHMPKPESYIRYIYNRTILETANIRAAAISALAKFAVVCSGSMRSSCKVLISRYEEH